MTVKKQRILLIILAVVLFAASAVAWFYFGGIDLVQSYVVPLLGIIGCCCVLYALPQALYERYSLLTHVRNAVVFMVVAFLLLLILGGLGVFK